MDLLWHSNLLLPHKVLNHLLHLPHPRMSHNGLQPQPLLRLELQYLFNQMLNILGQFRINLIRSFKHRILHLLYSLTLKRRRPMQQLIQQNTQRPYINLIVILATEYHFGCHILVCATKGIPLECAVLSRPTKITNLNIQILIK